MLCLPFADLEHIDSKEVAIFPSWRLIRMLLCFVRVCLEGHTKVKKKKESKNQAVESESSSRNQLLSTGGGELAMEDS